MRCSTLKEAELIPDSAVPYTLPQSRWNSSNRHKTSNEGKGEQLTHLTTCVRRRALNDAETQVAGLERAHRSWLVREKSWQPKIVVRLCASGSTFVVSVLSLQTARREGKDSRVAASAVSAASGLAAEQWQSKPTPRQRSVRSNANSGVACRKSVERFACLCCCLSVYVRVCLEFNSTCLSRLFLETYSCDSI